MSALPLRGVGRLVSVWLPLVACGAAETPPAEPVPPFVGHWRVDAAATEALNRQAVDPAVETEYGFTSEGGVRIAEHGQVLRGSWESLGGNVDQVRLRLMLPPQPGAPPRAIAGQVRFQSESIVFHYGASPVYWVLERVAP